MRLTRKRAKELSIEKWEWFYKHPSKISFTDLPKELQIKLAEFEANCPSCELYANFPLGICKSKCPFVRAKQQCTTLGSYYSMRQNAFSDKTRKKYAGLILQIINDWKI